jgi:tRNA pseudouridine32 synthase / 23S rRNA pseudouridine746 synthase
MHDSVFFRKFSSSLEHLPRPKKFTFPFYYTPHPLAISAANELQQELESAAIEHNFGFSISEKSSPIGKMFGVLVVQNLDGKLGYLAAFSGKLGNKNHHSGFVPPVFDILESGSFFIEGEKEVSAINLQISTIESSTNYLTLKEKVESDKLQLSKFKLESRLELKDSKNQRKLRREKAQEKMSEAEYLKFLDELKNESIREQLFHKHELRRKNNEFLLSNAEFLVLKKQLDFLKLKRSKKSVALQQEIFEKYTFLNQAGNKKSLLKIFKNTIYLFPPAAAGECAAPKLLQYAFLNQLKPICMAEFWWGASPNSEVREHKQFYPACKSKCEPILKHMLDGIDIDVNPLLAQKDIEELEVIFEDDHLLFINKPTEFLSVPGKQLNDSVYARVKEKYPNVSGPLLVHRLDMSTSGILMIAKSKEVHKLMQEQFLRKTIQKSYVALLEGFIEKNEGEIDLPLRGDFDDRPKQLVCHEFGKAAKTKFRVLSREGNTTRVLFSPLTGRTHQLRVHAAHHLGLGCPIIGDDLYGKKSTRLYLHAQELIFIHPISKKEQIIYCKAPF